MSQSLKAIFAVPAVVGVATAVGLVSALVGDGLWDAVSWVTLGFAVVPALWYSVPPGPRRPEP